MTPDRMSRWQLTASNGRKSIIRVCTVLGRLAAESRGQRWVTALGAPWTLTKVEEVAS